MENKIDIIKMMNEKLDELVERGIPVFMAKLIVAKAAIVMAEEMGVDQDTIMKFAEVITK